MKKQNWLYLAIGGLIAFVLGLFYYLKEEAPSHQSPDHMAKMREAKEKKSAQAKDEGSENLNDQENGND